MSENNTVDEKLESKKKIRKIVIPVAGGVVLIALIITVIGIITAHSKANKEPDYVDIGMQYLSELNYSQAIAAFENALEIDPRNVEAYIGLAEVYKAQENYPAIVQLLENAEKIFGDEFPPRLQEYLDYAYEKSISGADVVDLTSELTLFGDAVMLQDESIELTPLEEWKGGSVWLENSFKSSKGFVVSFEYYAGEGRDDPFGGADGIALCLSSEKGLGGQGEELGFVPGSYGVEFDSYPFNGDDPGEKHVAIISGYTTNHVSYVVDDRVDDSKWHKVVFFFRNGTVEVYLDGDYILGDKNVYLPENVFIGISASTGSGKNHQMIRKFGLTQEALN